MISLSCTKASKLCKKQELDIRVGVLTENNAGERPGGIEAWLTSER